MTPYFSIERDVCTIHNTLQWRITGSPISLILYSADIMHLGCCDFCMQHTLFFDQTRGMHHSEYTTTKNHMVSDFPYFIQRWPYAPSLLWFLCATPYFFDLYTCGCSCCCCRTRDVSFRFHDNDESSGLWFPLFYTATTMCTIVVMISACHTLTRDVSFRIHDNDDWLGSLFPIVLYVGDHASHCYYDFWVSYRSDFWVLT